MKIVYIAALGHSGSTILDMCLGCARNAVGLGEVKWALTADIRELNTHERFNEARCSCGSTIGTCEFWQDAKRGLLNAPTSGPSEKYKRIVDCFRKHYGDECTLVDSSKKTGEALLHLKEIHDLRVIFLVRDVRSWSYSRHSRHGTSRVRLALQWYRGNKRILDFLTRNKLNFAILGYEEYAIYSDYMLKEICRYTEIEYDDNCLIPGKTHSHVLNGNVAKGDDDKRSGILYDARWMTQSNMLLGSPFALPIMKLNQKLVYSNFITGHTQAFGLNQQEFLFFGNRQKEELLNRGWGLK